MSATVTTRRQPPEGGGAARPDPPRTPAGRARVPQLAVGLLLTAGAALAFVLFNAASVHRVPVLALAVDVPAGHVLAAADLQVVHVGTDDPLALTPPDQERVLVGRVATGDLAAGTLVTEGQFAAGPPLTAGDGVVGLALSPGQYPSSRLTVGDRVDVIVTGEPAGGSAGAGVSAGGGGRLLVRAARVVWVEPLGSQGQRLISLLAGEQAAGQVAAAAEAGHVRLVQVPAGDGGGGGEVGR